MDFKIISFMIGLIFVTVNTGMASPENQTDLAAKASIKCEGFGYDDHSEGPIVPKIGLVVLEENKIWGTPACFQFHYKGVINIACFDLFREGRVSNIVLRLRNKTANQVVMTRNTPPVPGQIYSYDIPMTKRFSDDDNPPSVHLQCFFNSVTWQGSTTI